MTKSNIKTALGRYHAASLKRNDLVKSGPKPAPGHFSSYGCSTPPAIMKKNGKERSDG